MKTKFAGLILALTAAPAFSQTGPAWAWTSGKVANNGSIGVKSTNGAGTYSAVQNPIGAVAKTNQSAFTQPPTVIIQATGTAGGYIEALPLLVSVNPYSNQQPPAPPICPSGYTAVWSKVMPSGGKGMTFNVAGTRFSFGLHQYSSNTYVGWLFDGPVKSTGLLTDTSMPELVASSSYHVAGTLCTK